MSRRLLVSIHLYLAAFFAPMVLIMAVSGGLYLLGEKGQMQSEEVGFVTGLKLDAESPSLSDDVQAALLGLGVDTSFEYVKAKGKEFSTRPSSREHYQLSQRADGVAVSVVSPSLQAAVMELHKGHGPSWYKRFETAFALGLIFIMISGLYLGLMSKAYRGKTMALSAAGAIIFLALVFL
jgi:hypothetical protein